MVPLIISLIHDVVAGVPLPAWQQGEAVPVEALCMPVGTYMAPPFVVNLEVPAS